jgi:integrase
MGTRADNRDGSCRQVASGRHTGRWRVQYTVEDELGRKKRLSRLFARQSEGKQFLRGLRREDPVDIARQLEGLTLGDWFQWLAENDWSECLAERTVADRSARFRKYVAPVWADVPLMKIDPIKVKLFYRELADNRVGQATILEIKRDMVRTFNQAISPYKRVPSTWGNPFRITVKVPPPRTGVALSPSNAQTALASKELDLGRRSMLALFLLAGVRLGEQMAMTKEQLLFDEDLIYIDRAVQVGSNGRQWTGLPKGHKKRTAVMCASLKRLLAEYTKDMQPSDLLWAAATENKPRMKKLVYATWRTLVKDAGLPEDMTPHDCRLTHVNWIEKLMPEVSTTTLKEHVGHASVGVTEINYTRPLTPAQDLLRMGIERMISPHQDGQNHGAAQVA